MTDDNDIFILLKELEDKARRRKGLYDTNQWRELEVFVSRLVSERAQGLAPCRRRLPDTRTSKTRRFSLPGDGEDERFKMYATVGFFEDGTPGEFFVRAARAGSLAAGLLDGLAVAISLGLQHGVPLEVFAEKFRATKFSPAGMTGDREYPVAKSPLDYLAAWMRKLAGGEMSPGKSEEDTP